MTIWEGCIVLDLKLCCRLDKLKPDEVHVSDFDLVCWCFLYFVDSAGFEHFDVSWKIFADLIYLKLCLLL